MMLEIIDSKHIKTKFSPNRAQFATKINEISTIFFFDFILGMRNIITIYIIIYIKIHLLSIWNN